MTLPNLVIPNNHSINCARLPQTGQYGGQAPSLYKVEENPYKNITGQIEFSFFNRPVQNIYPSKIIGIKEVFSLLVSPIYASTTRILRSLNDADRARQFKARNFDYCCFSGVFSKRCDKGLIAHSGLLTLDFDHVKNATVLKSQLIKDKNFETVLAFISPSGDGLKWIIKIDLSKNTHLEWFLAIQSYVRAIYKLEIDKSGKDVSRCCFIPYDPEAYISEAALKIL